jgi:hypothetical protein
MTTKYGIRYYPSTGVYMAFKDTVFSGIVLKRDWITNDGDIVRKRDRMMVCIQLSKEAAMGNIREYFIRQEVINAKYVDEYVYKEEWWEK